MSSLAPLPPLLGSGARVCIFCREATRPPWNIEHIISESLWCPPQLVLEDGEVCNKCNATCGKRDEKLVEVLRPFTVLPYKFKTKHGRWPRAELDNGSIQRTDEGIHIHLHDQDAPTIDPNDPPTHFVIRLSTRVDERAVRGFSKIALELVAKLEGREVALRQEYDAIRDYVLGRHNEFRPVLAVHPLALGSERRHGSASIITHREHGRFVFLWLLSACFAVSLNGSAESVRAFGACLNARKGALVARWLDRRGTAHDPT